LVVTSLPWIAVYRVRDELVEIARVYHGAQTGRKPPLLLSYMFWTKRPLSAGSACQPFSGSSSTPIPGLPAAS